jgi:hypothetical protein
MLRVTADRAVLAYNGRQVWVTFPVATSRAANRVPCRAGRGHGFTVRQVRAHRQERRGPVQSLVMRLQEKRRVSMGEASA